jgi:hypothetical protein
LTIAQLEGNKKTNELECVAILIWATV